MIRSLLALLSFALLFSSCTMIYTTNYPGKSQKEFPKEWLGKYEFVKKSQNEKDKDSVNNEWQFATIENNRVIFSNNDIEIVYPLGDTINYSIIDKTGYVSLLEPNDLFLVFKAIKKTDTLYLYPLYPDDDVTEADLRKYFGNVEEIESPDGRSTHYKVAIIDEKLDAYFKSPIPSKEPIKLAQIK